MTESDALTHGTGQARIQMWHDGLAIFKQNPILGAGPEQFVMLVGKACHNSFVQSYADLGFFGGTFFVGAFYLAIVSMWRGNDALDNEVNDDEESERLAPLVAALIVGYGFAIFALNHLYSAGTYLVLALATCEIHLGSRLLGENPQGRRSLMVRLLGVSVGFLVIIYLSAKLLVNW
jgi:O-antigen ligase